LQDLGLGEMADADLGHHRNGDHVLDLPDHVRLGHACDAAHLPDVGGDALQGHDGHRTGLLGDLGLLGIGDVHDDAALEHFGQTHLVAEQLLDLLVVAGSLHDSSSLIKPVRNEASAGQDPAPLDLPMITR